MEIDDCVTNLKTAGMIHVHEIPAGLATREVGIENVRVVVPFSSLIRRVKPLKTESDSVWVFQRSEFQRAQRTGGNRPSSGGLPELAKYGPSNRKLDGSCGGFMYSGIGKAGELCRSSGSLTLELARANFAASKARSRLREMSSCRLDVGIEATLSSLLGLLRLA